MMDNDILHMQKIIIKFSIHRMCTIIFSSDTVSHLQVFE